MPASVDLAVERRIPFCSFFVARLLQRGVGYQSLQNYDKAIEDFTAVLKLDPENPQAVNNRGFTYYLRNEPKKAVADFTVAIGLNPKSGLAYNNRGFNRQMFGDYAGAIEDFNKAIELSPKYALAFPHRYPLYPHYPHLQTQIQMQPIRTTFKPYPILHLQLLHLALPHQLTA